LKFIANGSSQHACDNLKIRRYFRDIRDLLANLAAVAPTAHLWPWVFVKQNQVLAAKGFFS